MICPECGKPTNGSDGPITHKDGTIETCVFKCSTCSKVYTGRQAIAAEARGASTCD